MGAFFSLHWEGFLLPMGWFSIHFRWIFSLHMRFFFFTSSFFLSPSISTSSCHHFLHLPHLLSNSNPSITFLSSNGTCLSHNFLQKYPKTWRLIMQLYSTQICFLRGLLHSTALLSFAVGCLLDCVVVGHV